MTQGVEVPNIVQRASALDSVMTPAGLQANAELQRRRQIVMVLNVATYILLLSLAASVFGAGGWSIVGWVVFLCFAVGTPWTVLGFWNAVIGLWLLHGRRDALAEVAPYMAVGELMTPLAVKTAIIMTLRNEEPGRAITRLRTVKKSVDATGDGAAFSYFLLSDTNIAEVAAAEEALVAERSEERRVGKECA